MADFVESNCMTKEIAMTALVVFVVSCSLLLIDLSSLKYFHRDEINWTRTSIFSFRTFFIDRDFRNPGWSKTFNTFGKQNPQIGKFIMGSSLWLHGYRNFDGVIRWNDREDLTWHTQQSFFPTAGELYAARLPIVLLASATAFLICIITAYSIRILFHSASLSAGVFASFVFLSHPIAWAYAHRAMIDIPPIFFSTLAVILVIVSIRAFLRESLLQSVLLSLGGAIASGLAISTKMNALLLILVLQAIYLAFLGTVWRSPLHHRRPPAMRCYGVYAALHAIVPAAIFVFSNPFLYKNPISGIATMLNFGARIASRRADLPDVALYTLQEKVGAFMGLGFGSLASLFHTTTFLDLLFVGAGFVVITVILFEGFNSDIYKSMLCLFLLLWAAITGLGVILWTPLAWARYYIPWFPPASVLAGVGAGWLLVVSRRSMARLRQSSWIDEIGGTHH
jgi:4-amino-4-deoxy-L-arabinose transferase-like glycosyltransferase